MSVKSKNKFRRKDADMEDNKLENGNANTAEEAGCEHCIHKTKQRSEKEYKDLVNRLSRIEGQVRGVKKMVENDAYCPDILIQVAAVTAALNSFSKVLLTEHIKTCVTDDIKAGNEATVDELVKVLHKMMR
jgi:DNA-binding FrmR family transcriptional regulator